MTPWGFRSMSGPFEGLGAGRFSMLGWSFVALCALADEDLSFPLGSASTVRLGELTVGRIIQQPGWRWSEHIRPIAQTASCQFHHIGVHISGRVRCRLDDGTEFEVREGDVFDIPPGHDVWVVGDEPSVQVIWGGWRGWGKPPVGERVLSTLLFTDIVGSTERASRIGDAAWDKVLEQHNERVREVLERYRGTEIDTTGDGFFATFDGAARRGPSSPPQRYKRRWATSTSRSEPPSTPARSN